MKRRHLFARLLALIAAPAAVKAMPPQIILKHRTPGSSTYSVGYYAGWLEVERLRNIGVVLTPEQARDLMDRAAARFHHQLSQQGRFTLPRP